MYVAMYPNYENTNCDGSNDEEGDEDNERDSISENNHSGDNDW